jgi:N-acetylmuramoyl-L-alanine amidase/rhodanese-related sulfurtransferase
MATRIPVIVIDPGHGGSAAIGGSSPNNATGPNGLLEKDLTLDLARRVASSLAGRARVLLTRSDDTNLSLADRADVARTNDALLFLSIHLNGWSDARVDGTEVYVSRRASDVSRGFAQRVLSHLLAVTQVANRGVKEADFGVLLPARHATGTAVCLAEVAFLTNPTQAAKLTGEEYKRAIAEALTDAVRLYLPSEHFLHHDAVRPDRRIPPPVPFSLSAWPEEQDAWTVGMSYRPSHGPAAAAASFDTHADPFVPSASALDSRIRFVLEESVGDGGRNRGDDVQALKERLIELGFDWLMPDRKLDADTYAAINLVQSIVAGQADKPVKGDRLVSVPGATYRWLQASNAPRWQLMPAGSRAEGFDNIELPNKGDLHDFGTQWLADSLKGAGAHYRDNYLNTQPGAALLTINDASLPRGGRTPDHAGHQKGLSCDLRLPRTDGTAPGSTTFNHAKYDRAATRAMIRALRAQPLHSYVLFNDSVLIGEGLCKHADKHDDHVHFAIKPPAQGGIELVDVRPGEEFARRGATGGVASSASALAREAHGDPWTPSSTSLSQSPCGCAGCAECAPPTARMLKDDCKNTKNIPACEIVHDYQPLTTAHANNNPNLFLRWNDIPSGTCVVDVVVHFHGWARDVAVVDPKDKKKLLKSAADMTVLDKIPVSGLDFSDPKSVKTPDGWKANNLPSGWKQYAPTKCAVSNPPVRKGRPTLCILPLGRHTPKADSDAYDLSFFTSDPDVPKDCQQTALQRLIRDSLDLLATRNGLSAGTFTQGRLILTAHSGGGAPLAHVLNQRASKGGPRCHNVNEVHLFDAVYGGASTIAEWANERIAEDVKNKLTEAQMPTRGGALRVLYLPCSASGWTFRVKDRKEPTVGECKMNSETETGSRRVQRNLNFKGAPAFLSDFYRVEQASIAHMAIPSTYGFQLLENAGVKLKDVKVKKTTDAAACCPEWPEKCSVPQTCKGMPAPQPVGAGKS